MSLGTQRGRIDTSRARAVSLLGGDQGSWQLAFPLFGGGDDWRLAGGRFYVWLM